MEALKKIVSSDNSSFNFNMSTVGTESHIKKSNQSGGGFFDLFLSADNEALVAFNDHELEAVSYIIRRPKPSLVIKGSDENGFTVLHHIIVNYKDLKNPLELLRIVLKHKDIQCIINSKTKNDGMTPLFMAVKLQLPEIVLSELVNAGADPKIGDKFGNILETEASEKHIEIEVKGNIEDKQLKEQVDKTISSFFNDLSKARRTDTSEATLALNTPIPPVIEKFESIPMAPVENKPVESVPVVPIGMKEPVETKLELPPVVVPPLSEQVEKEKTEVKTVSPAEASTSEIVKNIVAEYENRQGQAGGSKKTIMGQRKLNNYSDYDGYESMGEQSGGEGASELSRLIRSQSDEIHQRTTETIMKIMNVDEVTAGYYKSALYWKVKEEHPELKSIERALEMEKLATEENLKQIDPKEIKEKIIKYREAKGLPGERSLFEKAEKKKKEPTEKKEKKEKKGEKKEKKEKTVKEEGETKKKTKSKKKVEGGYKNKKLSKMSIMSPTSVSSAMSFSETSAF